MKNFTRIYILLALISIFLPSPRFAQGVNESTAKSQLITSVTEIHEFSEPLSECELGALVDVLFSALNDNPNSKGYIISYNGADQLPAEYDSRRKQARLEREIKKHISLRQFEQKKLIFVYGGFRDKLVNEIWLVPNGEAPPQPSNTINKPSLPKDKTFLYDKNF